MNDAERQRENAMRAEEAAEEYGDDSMTAEMPRCNTCDHWRHIRDEDLTTKDTDGEERTWQGPHGECMLISRFSTDQSAWLSVHKALKNEDGSWADQEEAEKRCHLDASLITHATFSCPYHSDHQWLTLQMIR